MLPVFCTVRSRVERPDLDPVELDDWRKYGALGHTEPGGLYTTDAARSRTADVANVPGSGVDFGLGTEGLHAVGHNEADFCTLHGLLGAKAVASLRAVWKLPRRRFS